MMLLWLTNLDFAGGGTVVPELSGIGAGTMGGDGIADPLNPDKLGIDNINAVLPS